MRTPIAGITLATVLALAGSVVGAVDSEESYNRFRAGLGERSWLVDRVVSRPFEITAVFQQGGTTDTAAQRLGARENRVSVDITELVGLSSDVNADEVTFLGLYPSGAVRGVSATLHRDADHLSLTLETPIALVDPDSPFDSVPPSGLRCAVTLIGIELPPYGG